MLEIVGEVSDVNDEVRNLFPDGSDEFRSYD
jgi:hypothetical protein